MAMYESGTVTGAVNSLSVTGTGTKWADAKNGVSRHSVLVVVSTGTVDVYQIDRVKSDTELTVTRKITRAFKDSQYGIMTAEMESTASFAKRLNVTLAYYQEQLNAWQSILTGKGEVTVTAPDGTEVVISLDNIAASESSKAAIAAAKEAKASETKAATSQKSAKTSEDNAAKSAAAAKTSEGAAKSSQDAAAGSQKAAKASEAVTKASETAAKNSETAAGKSATTAKASENLVVSSRDDAQKAATAARASETAAKASESAAVASAGQAKSSETAAKASQTTAATSATSADASAKSAKASETVAGKSATTATQQADRAKTEADRAETIAGDKQPVNPLLTAISALDTAAGQIIRLTGKNTVATTALTELGRKLLAAGDAKKARQELGLGELAIKDGLNSTDIAPVEIGDAKDLNDYVTPGQYYQTLNAQAQSGKNYPTNEAGSLTVYRTTAAGITQVYIVYNNSAIYCRSVHGGVWKPWERLYTTAYKPTAAEVGALSLGAFGIGSTAPANPPDYNQDFFTIVDCNETFTVTGAWKNGPPGYKSQGGIAHVYRRAYSTGSGRIIHFMALSDPSSFVWHNWYLVSSKHANTQESKWVHRWIKNLDSINTTAEDVGAVDKIIKLQNIKNFDELNQSGFYNISGIDKEAVNPPPFSGNGYGNLLVIGSGADLKTYCTQIATDKSTGITYTRIRNDGNMVWSAWRRIYDSINPPTAGDVGALPITGGTVDGQIDVSGSITSHSNIVMYGDHRQHFSMLNNDGTSRMHLWKDAGGDGVYLTNADDGSENFVFGKDGQFYVPWNIVLGTSNQHGGAKIHSDGNISGRVWSDNLHSFIHRSANSRVGSVRFVDGGEVEASGEGWVPWGSVCCGIRYHMYGASQPRLNMYLKYKWLQVLVNDNWYTVG